MHRRTLLKAAAATTVGGALVPMAEGALAGALAAPAVDQVLATGLSVPWGVAFLATGDALVGERNSGRLFRVSATGGKTLVGTVPGVVSGGEGGLLGLALSPRFATDSWLYAYLSTASDNRIVRMQYAAGVLGPPETVLPGIPYALHHNGGRLVFGPDGHLYASTGDASDRSRAQDKSSLGGKILRMTPTGQVPVGNPFGNHVWSYGHRNVEGITFDGRGRLWASEFGENRRDELNRIVRGGNYGWPRSEGSDGPGGYRDPLASWSPEYCSPSGVAVAGGRAFLGALRGEALWAVKLTRPHRGRKVRYLHHRFGRIRTVQRAPDGTLWITTSNVTDDRVIRITVR